MWRYLANSVDIVVDRLILVELVRRLRVIFTLKKNSFYIYKKSISYQMKDKAIGNFFRNIF